MSASEHKRPLPERKKNITPITNRNGRPPQRWSPAFRFQPTKPSHKGPKSLRRALGRNPSPGLGPATILLVEVEDGAVAHALQAVYDAAGRSLFLHLLADKLPKEILGSLVALGDGLVEQFVDEAADVALVL